MQNEITTGLLQATLTQELVNSAFEIARTNRTGILSVATMGAVQLATEGDTLQWLDHKVDAQGSTVTTAASDTDTAIVVAAGSKFRVGMLVSVQNSDEVILVTAVDTATNTLTVERGFGGTTAAAIALNSELVVDSTSREENSLAENDGLLQPIKRSNYFQTMDTALEMSRRALAKVEFGNTNDLTVQLAERVRQLAIQMDRALVRGRKATATIGGKERTYTGGLKYFLDQPDALKFQNGGQALSLDNINNVNAEIVKNGGIADTIAVGIDKARDISKLVRGNYSSERLADWSADEGSVLRLPTDLPLIGNVNTIVIDTNLNDDELVIFDKSKINVIPMAANNAADSGAWRTMDATQPAQDGQRVRIVGDFGMEIRQSETHMARLSDIG